MTISIAFILPLLFRLPGMDSPNQQTTLTFRTSASSSEA